MFSCKRGRGVDSEGDRKRGRHSTAESHGRSAAPCVKHTRTTTTELNEGPACFVPTGTGGRALPLEVVAAVLERSELSIQELLKISTLCSTFRHAIEQSMALREKMFIRESARTVELNTFLLRPEQLLGCTKFWNSVSWLTAARGSRWSEMLLCQPGATVIDLTYYDPRQRRAPNRGRVTVQLRNAIGVRLKDVISALDAADVTWLSSPSIAVVEPSYLAFALGTAARTEKPEPRQNSDVHDSCRVAMQGIILQLSTLQASVEALHSAFRDWKQQGAER